MRKLPSSVLLIVESLIDYSRPILSEQQQANLSENI
jgi:hypothetical protein